MRRLRRRLRRCKARCSRCRRFALPATAATARSTSRRCRKAARSRASTKCSSANSRSSNRCHDRRLSFSAHHLCRATGRTVVLLPAQRRRPAPLRRLRHEARVCWCVAVVCVASCSHASQRCCPASCAADRLAFTSCSASPHRRRQDDEPSPATAAAKTRPRGGDIQPVAITSRCYCFLTRFPFFHLVRICRACRSC